ncbi:TetR/AcrR family transcriptional regulator [Enterococcus quebecensis]|uniref:HTH tetR-type domain-containing protein n=1 Tax=Enterococcus quebecensis TaxID=903983 RepID=A0A1E5GQQ0_9ENTE|nr:TetR/AcrR family transcriptional regulator [Enterococcus quebecensis]OEG15048.1 hypothetical protein BCR23_11415 [Enterococcus quebecensis]OJG74333.1 hypothetical protein RV12_GL002680 [Enterococcus quebecensis]
MRKKVYTKKHILAAARDLLVEKGFSFITARNVAEHMGISTQPIYLEFKNMEDLKLTLLNSVYEYLETEFFTKKQTTDSFTNFGLGYINLAKSDNKLYISLYLDQHSYGQELQNLSFDLFQKCMKSDEKYVAFSKEQLEKLHMQLLIVATGMASLTLSGILKQTEEQLVTAFDTVKENSIA